MCGFVLALLAIGTGWDVWVCAGIALNIIGLSKQEALCCHNRCGLQTLWSTYILSKVMRLVTWLLSIKAKFI